jgi:hypothetical protein
VASAPRGEAESVCQLLHQLGYPPKRPRVWVKQGATRAEKARFIAQVHQHGKGKRLFFRTGPSVSCGPRLHRVWLPPGKKA